MLSKKKKKTKPEFGSLLKYTDVMCTKICYKTVAWNRNRIIMTTTLNDMCLLSLNNYNMNSHVKYACTFQPCKNCGAPFFGSHGYSVLYPFNFNQFSVSLTLTMHYMCPARIAQLNLAKYSHSFFYVY